MNGSFNRYGTHYGEFDLDQAVALLPGAGQAVSQIIGGLMPSEYQRLVNQITKKKGELATVSKGSAKAARLKAEIASLEAQLAYMQGTSAQQAQAASAAATAEAEAETATQWKQTLMQAGLVGLAAISIVSVVALIAKRK